MVSGDDNAELGDQSFQYITTDSMKSMQDDSLVRGTASYTFYSFSTTHRPSVTLQSFDILPTHTLYH